MVVGVGEEVVVPDDVALPVGDIEAVALALIVDDGVIGGVAMGDKLRSAVIDGTNVEDG